MDGRGREMRGYGRSREVTKVYKCGVCMPTPTSPIMAKFGM